MRHIFYLFCLLSLSSRVSCNPSLVWWQIKGYSPWRQGTSREESKHFFPTVTSPFPKLKGIHNGKGFNLNIFKYFAKKNKEEDIPLNPKTEAQWQLWEHGEKKVWEESLKWEQLAARKEQEVNTARISALYLAVVGAALQTLGSQIASKGWICSVSGGTCLGLVPVITSKFLNKNNIADKSNSRLIADLLRSEVYKSLAKVEPYGSHSRRGHKLKEVASRITESFTSDDLSNELMVVNFEEKYLPRVPDDYSYKAWYVENRLKSAVSLKRKRAEKKLRRSRCYKVLQFTLSTIGGLIGIVGGSISGSSAKQNVVSIIQGKLGVWVSVIAAAYAAISAHCESTKLDEEVSRLFHVVRHLEEHEEWRNLEILQGGKLKTESEVEWNAFVGYCEALLNCESLPWGGVFVNCTSF